MADIQNTVELPKEETAPVAAVEPAATEATVAPAIVAQDKSVDETKPAEATTEAKTEEKADEEIKPVEEGHLAHKAQGASFPKNLIPSKEFFFFGSESFEPKALSGYLRGEKNTEHAHHNVSWASHTGKGLLFVGDKKSPSSVINLADTTEPEIDGSNKFHFTHKGAKHSFKAATTSERDNWVAQLKTKIAEARELAVSVTESEVYKTALDSFKSAEETKAEDAAKTEDIPVTEATDAAVEDKAAEESKRRSASRKRGSIFGFGKKDSAKEKKDEVKTDIPAAEVEAVVPVAEPATEALKVEEPSAAEGEVSATADEKGAEEDKPAESLIEKFAASKRNSFFGGVFSKKEKKAGEAKPAEEGAKESDTTDAAAPVIPPVESTSPLSAEEVNAAVENADDTSAPATQTVAKKDSKEKRKSSLPFAFGRREKSPARAEGEEKRQSQSPFSKLRATIKSKTGGKADEKQPAEEAVKESSAAPDTVAPPATAVESAPEGAEPEAENKPENVAATTPAVTAAA